MLHKRMRDAAPRLSFLAVPSSTGHGAPSAPAPNRAARRAHLRAAHAASNPVPAPVTPQLSMAGMAEGLDQAEHGKELGGDIVDEKGSGGAVIEKELPLRFAQK